MVAFLKDKWFSIIFILGVCYSYYYYGNSEFGYNGLIFLYGVTALASVLYTYLTKTHDIVMSNLRKTQDTHMMLVIEEFISEILYPELSKEEKLIRLEQVKGLRKIFNYMYPEDTLAELVNIEEENYCIWCEESKSVCICDEYSSKGV